MILRIRKNEKIENSIWFEGYYNHEKHGLVTHREELFDKDYVDREKRNLNGLFRGITVQDDFVEAWVDRYRSMPIFYIKSKEEMIIGSDFFELYKEGIADGFEFTFDNISANNYVRFGYVPHENTLINEIKELKCGSVLRIDKKTLKISHERYWKFEYKENLNFNYDDEKKSLKAVYDEIFKDYCKHINRNKKKVNFALSGGLDSRLVLSGIMKYIDDKKRIALNTFGNIFSEDVKIPYKIAHENNVELNHFSISEFGNMFKENEVMTNATQGRSLSHYQDGFPLVEGNKLERDEIWLFGHTGDFIGGGHISRKAYYAPFDKYKEKFTELILDKHSFDKKKNKFYQAEMDGVKTKETLLSELDRWDMENRQSKFIINDCATYRQFDDLVMLPLWDNRLVDFFLKVPFKYKVEKVIYNDVSIDYLKEMKLHKHLSKSYYKKDTVLYLIKNKIKIMTQSSERFMLSHGFNVYFTRDYVIDKVDSVFDMIKDSGVELEECRTTHFNHYLALIELNKIIKKLKSYNSKNLLESGGKG